MSDAQRDAIGGDGARATVEAAGLIERLDAENEHYLLLTTELRDLLEDAVTREVALERSNLALQQRVDRAEAEVRAVHDTKVMRLSRIPRSWYSKVRRRRG